MQGRGNKGKITRMESAGRCKTARIKISGVAQRLIGKIEKTELKKDSVIKSLV